MKITEKAAFPGMCFICAQPIRVDDIIVRSQLGITPVAAHASCDPELAIGGSAPAEKLTLRAETGIRATPDQQLHFLIRDVLPVLAAVCSGYVYDPGSSDLDDEQSITVRMDLGTYRRASRLKYELEKSL